MNRSPKKAYFWRPGRPGEFWKRMTRLCRTEASEIQVNQICRRQNVPFCIPYSCFLRLLWSRALSLHQFRQEVGNMEPILPPVTRHEFRRTVGSKLKIL